MEAPFFNAYIGGSSGVFKGVFAQEKNNLIVKSLCNLNAYKNPITCMNWTDGLQNKIVVGYGNQIVKVYDVKTRSFTSSYDLKCGEGPIVGVCKYKGAFVTAIESGTMKIWNWKNIQVISTGNHLAVMRQYDVERHLVATGGNENDLKLWDLQVGKQIFSAKNVRHDNLEMRVPVWVTDICFMRESKKIAVTTRHGHVRLYDPNSNMRRPVVNVTVPEQSLLSMSTCSKDHHVVVGSTTGQMNLVDLRSKGLVMNKYKGFTGSIRGIACPEMEPYIVSVSADRHLRIHHLTTKEMIFKEYVQQEINCVLVKKDFRLSYDWDEWEDIAEGKKDEKDVETDLRKGSSGSEESSPRMLPIYCPPSPQPTDSPPSPVVPPVHCPPSRPAKHTRKKHKAN